VRRYSPCEMRQVSRPLLRMFAKPQCGMLKPEPPCQRQFTFQASLTANCGSSGDRSHLCPVASFAHSEYGNGWPAV